MRERQKTVLASITNLTAKMSEDSERIFEHPNGVPLGSKGSWASPLSDCPSFSLILDESMVEEAGDGWPVKPHSVGQPAPWNPSSPSLVDGSLYTSSRLLMHHYDMCPQDRQYYFD